MAFFNKVMYLSYGNGGTTGFYALPKRLPSTAYAVGAIVREFTTASIGNERAYLCVLAGTTSAAGDGPWGYSLRCQQTTDGTVSWYECSGHPAVNGDFVNTPSWAEIKATGLTCSRGAIIKRNNGASYQIMTAGSSVPGD